MENFWWIFAVLCSVVVSCQILYNQIFKFNSTLITIYRGLGTALVLLPFIIIFEPIYNTNFYLLCFVQGAAIAFFDNRLFSASRLFGASITSLIQPLTLIFTFSIWFCFSYKEIAFLNLSIITTSLLCISVCIFLLQNNSETKKALIYLFPALLCIVFIDVMGKKIMIMGQVNILSAVYYYALITSIVAGIANLCVYVKKEKTFQNIITKKNILLIGFPIVFIVISTNILKMYGVFLAENPAYVGAILYSSPVWILIVNRYLLRKTENNNYENPNKWLVFGVVISAILIVVFS